MKTDITIIDDNTNRTYSLPVSHPLAPKEWNEKHGDEIDMLSIELRYGTLDYYGYEYQYAGYCTSEVEDFPSLLAEINEAYRRAGFSVGNTYFDEANEKPLPTITDFAFDEGAEELEKQEDVRAQNAKTAQSLLDMLGGK